MCLFQCFVKHSRKGEVYSLKRNKINLQGGKKNGLKILDQAFFLYNKKRMELGALIPDYFVILDESLGFIALYRGISAEANEQGKLQKATQLSGKGNNLGNEM